MDDSSEVVMLLVIVFGLLRIVLFLLFDFEFEFGLNCIVKLVLFGEFLVSVFCFLCNICIIF